MMDIDKNTLLCVLGKMFGKPMIHADDRTEQLHGGTLGDVQLVTGTACAADGQTLPYRVVWKTQKKWERHGDPDSWRREYDLYASGLDSLFCDSLRWPRCYHAQIIDDETQLWLEYIEGTSGKELTGDMYELAAEELGRFQGRLYAQHHALLEGLTNLSGPDYPKNFYLHYRSWNVVHDYTRSDDCPIPGHLCQMLIDLDHHCDQIFAKIEKLPIVLCHRDFWVENIFYEGGSIRLIDWDTAGWGYLGEDIASLIADEADVAHMAEYYLRCVPAYYRGFSQYADAPPLSEHCVHEFVLLLFGYRLIEWYLYAESAENKALHLAALQKIYEMQ